MGHFFAALYQFFAQRIALFVSLLVLVLALLFYGVSRLQLQEDITQMLPNEPRLNAINSALQEVKFSDKIVVAISANKDNPEELISAADGFYEKLKTLQPSYIQEINYTLDDEQMLYYFDLFYEYLPLYLDEKDYAEIDSAISYTRVESALQSAYKLLLTPAGSFVQKTLTRDPLNMTPRALRKLQGLQADENIITLNNRLYSKDQKHILLFITPTYKAKESNKNAELLLKIQDFVAEHQTEAQCQIHYFGSPLVSAGNAIQIKKDVNITMSLVAVALFIFLLYFYRKPQYFFILVVPVAFGGIFGLGVMGLINPNVSAISLGVGAILLGITIDYALHVFSHYQYTNSKKELLLEISQSLILSCITTVLAFFALQFTGSPVLHDLGMFAGLSIIGAAIGSLVILPFLLPKKSNKVDRSNLRLEKVVAFPFHKNKYSLIGIIAISIGAILFYKTPRFENNMDNLNYMSESMQNSERFLDSLNDVSLRSIFLISRGKNLDEAMSKMESTHAIIADLEAKEQVKKASGTRILLLSKEAQQKKIDRWNAFWTPTKKEELIKNLKLASSKFGFKSHAFQPFYALLEKEFEVKELEEFSAFYVDGPLKEFITIHDQGASVFTLLKVKAEQRQNVFDAFEKNEEVIVFDKRYLTDQIVNSVSSDFSTLANWSLLLVFLVLLLAYGRFELAIIAFLPLGISWFWVMGAMQIFDLKLNLINLIITSFVFGLGIDYSIFILNGLIRDQKKGTQSLLSYKGSVFLSAFTTIIAVGGMIFAGHPALKSIAIMSIVGIGSVMILVYTLIPALYGFMVSNRIAKKRPPLTFVDMFGTTIAWLMILWGFHLILFYAIPIRLLFFIPLKYRKKSIHWLLYAWANIYLFIAFLGRKKYINEHKVDTKRQRIFIANHQSFIDTVVMFSLTPKMIIATNNRIFNNVIFGPICRICDFLNVAEGFDKIDAQVRTLWNDGFSIIIFPEGTRSEDQLVHRFHKGAFKLAEDLQAEILPIVLHGTGDFLPKGAYWGIYNDIVIKVLDPIKLQDNSWGITYSERSKKVRHFMASELDSLKKNYGMPYYLRNQILLNYLYIDPILYWYLFVKFKVENRYQMFNNHLPTHGNIYDVGCGNGMMTYILQYSEKKRTLFASDFDEDKIMNARSRYLKNDRIHFDLMPAQSIEPKAVSGAVFSDVLHYLNREEQLEVLKKFADELLPGGVILIKDGDAAHKRIKGTQTSEFISIKLTGFNKRMHPFMTYIDTAFLESFCKENGLRLEELELSKVTSNKIWKITHEV